MSNWSSTTITFYSENKEQLEAMHSKFNEIMNGKPTAKNNFNHGWMGDYANTFFPELGHEEIDCRGSVDDITGIERKQQYFEFTIHTETAWSPKIGMWHMIVKKFYPEVNIAYLSEESIDDYFCVWDKTEGKIFFPESIYIDGYLPTKEGYCESIDYHYDFKSIQEILGFLDFTLPFEYEHKENLDELTEEIQQKLEEYSEEHDCEDEEFFIQLVEIEEIDPAEFEL